MSTKFMIAEHVVCRKTNSELRMLFDRDKGVMYEMNDTASAVIELLSQSPARPEELAEALAGSFDGSLSEIRDDVERLLADFADAGLVQNTERS
jgi:hypothetical protein